MIIRKIVIEDTHSTQTLTYSVLGDSNYTLSNWVVSNSSNDLTTDVLYTFKDPQIALRALALLAGEAACGINISANLKGLLVLEHGHSNFSFTEETNRKKLEDLYQGPDPSDLYPFPTTRQLEFAHRHNTTATHLEKSNVDLDEEEYPNFDPR